MANGTERKLGAPSIWLGVVVLGLAFVGVFYRGDTLEPAAFAMWLGGLLQEIKPRNDDGK